MPVYPYGEQFQAQLVATEACVEGLAREFRASSGAGIVNSASELTTLLQIAQNRRQSRTLYKKIVNAHDHVVDL